MTHRLTTYEQLKVSDDFAFVVTDIESSTELSQADPLAFQQARGLGCVGGVWVNAGRRAANHPNHLCKPNRLQMQEIHDSVMREGIARHGGYEIITEGDSFSVAFTSGARGMGLASKAPIVWEGVCSDWKSMGAGSTAAS
jgi:hypothetical protein